MCVLTYLINYSVLLQSVTGHGSYQKEWYKIQETLACLSPSNTLTPVNLLREKERERERGGEREGALSMKKDIDLRRERQWLPRVSSFYSVLLQSVTGHGSSSKPIEKKCVCINCSCLHKECYKIQETLACLSLSNN